MTDQDYLDYLDRERMLQEGSLEAMIERHMWRERRRQRGGNSDSTRTINLAAEWTEAEYEFGLRGAS